MLRGVRRGLWDGPTPATAAVLTALRDTTRHLQRPASVQVTRSDPDVRKSAGSGSSPMMAYPIPRSEARSHPCDRASTVSGRQLREQFTRTDLPRPEVGNQAC